MKILITGANGFVGTHLCNRLLSEGHTVYGLARNPAKVLSTHPNFIVLKGDLSAESMSWTNLLPDDLEACVHTAGIVHSYNIDHFFHVNTTGTKELVSALKKKFPNHLKFILVSSLAAAGPVNLGEKKKTNEPDFPVSQYGRSKKQAEEELRQIAPKSWITSIVRPPMVIGPGDAAVLDIFKMVKSRFVILPGRKSKLKEYSFVCVFDLVETIYKLLESNQSLFLYSAHDEVITFERLVSEIKQRMNIKILFYLPIPIFIVRLLGHFLNFLYKIRKHDLRLTPDKIYELDGSAWVCDNSESKTILKQLYKFPLDQTINITYEDYKKRNWL